MSLALTAVAAVLFFEGLALALAPSRIEDALRLLCTLSVEARRTIGFLAVVAGAAVFTLAGIL